MGVGVRKNSRTMVTHELYAPFANRSVSIQSFSMKRQFQSTFIKKLQFVGILRMKVVNKHLRVRHVFHCKPFLGERANFFPRVFQPGQHVAIQSARNRGNGSSIRNIAKFVETIIDLPQR